MIIDDIDLWSGKIIADFPDADDAWERVVRNEHFAGYRLLIPSEQFLLRWWGQQPYVVQQASPDVVKQLPPVGLISPIKRFIRFFLNKR